MNTALIYLQTAGKGLHPVSCQLAAKALTLSEHTAGLLVCQDLGPELKEALAQTGLDTVYIYIHKESGVFMQELHLAAFKDCIELCEPQIVLFGATLEGRTLAPMIGAHFKTGVTADCTALDLDEDGNLIQTRPAFGGRMMASIVTQNTRPQIATVRPGVFSGKLSKSKESPRFIFCEMPEAAFENRIFVRDKEPVILEQEQENILVAIGGGLKEKEDIAVFRNLADKLGASLMCSRALVERGWLPQSSQIGLSGQAVAPELLVTFGISGSVQFMAGIQGVKTLCVVNTDKDAELLKAADVPILGDMYEIIENLGGML